MSFYRFYREHLGIAEDGIHKECRAKDPGNCRKCHTGKFQVDVPPAKKEQAPADDGKEPWKVFKRGGKELFAYTVRGESSGEEEATRKQLAEEQGCKIEDITVSKVTRGKIKGKVPGEKPEEKKPDQQPGKGGSDAGENGTKLTDEELKDILAVTASAIHSKLAKRAEGKKS